MINGTKVTKKEEPGKNTLLFYYIPSLTESLPQPPKLGNKKINNGFLFPIPLICTIFA